MGINRNELGSKGSRVAQNMNVHACLRDCACRDQPQQQPQRQPVTGISVNAAGKCAILHTTTAGAVLGGTSIDG